MLLTYYYILNMFITVNQDKSVGDRHVQEDEEALFEDLRNKDLKYRSNVSTDTYDECVMIIL